MGDEKPTVMRSDQVFSYLRTAGRLHQLAGVDR
jgi:hypothetical protein